MAQLKFCSLTIILFLISPISTLATTNCSLPCKYQSNSWEIHVKEIKTDTLESGSLWFKLRNKELTKQDISIDGLVESPILELKLPFFQSVLIHSLPQNQEFIFQQWLEQINPEQLELVVTWLTGEEIQRETLIINLN
ncbi:hypothetical protein [Bacillus pinisoli]|uniref:hypothetical protein n=1 Tax=Bacillus pinisoli TaxID=2901866 RepID=UPI001FF1ADF2|nr:hypothetical protein [Bacillus pinisoli]